MTLILSTIEAELLQEYQKKFDELKKFAFELHKLDKLDMENQVLKEMVKLKMLIDYERTKKN